MDRVENQEKTSLLTDMAILGELLDRHYQNKGFKNRDDYEARKGSK